MQYLLLIYGEEGKQTQEEMKAAIPAWFEYTAALKEAGAFIAGEALLPSTTATSVRCRNGDTMHTDGPFAETKEVLGGFYMIKAADLDEALMWAAKCPGALNGTMEVRPIMTFD